MNGSLFRRQFSRKGLELFVHLEFLDVELFVCFTIPFKVGMPELQLIPGIPIDRIAVIAFLGNHGAHPFTLVNHLSIVDGLSQVATTGMLNKAFSVGVTVLKAELIMHFRSRL
jgi:hypothetical protein